MSTHQLYQALLIEPVSPMAPESGRAERQPGPCQGCVRIEVVRDIQRLRELVPAWEVLANSAVERNVFYEPFMVFLPWNILSRANHSSLF